jgi:hypothetical protein
MVSTAFTSPRNERWDIIILDRMLPGDVDGLAIIAGNFSIPATIVRKWLPAS